MSVAGMGNAGARCDERGDDALDPRAQKRRLGANRPPPGILRGATRLLLTCYDTWVALTVSLVSLPPRCLPAAVMAPLPLVVRVLGLGLPGLYLLATVLAGSCLGYAACPASCVTCNDTTPRSTTLHHSLLGSKVPRLAAVPPALCSARRGAAPNQTSLDEA